MRCENGRPRHMRRSNLGRRVQFLFDGADEPLLFQLPSCDHQSITNSGMLSIIILARQHCRADVATTHHQHGGNNTPHHLTIWFWMSGEGLLGSRPCSSARGPVHGFVDAPFLTWLQILGRRKRGLESHWRALASGLRRNKQVQTDKRRVSRLLSQLTRPGWC